MRLRGHRSFSLPVVLFTATYAGGLISAAVIRVPADQPSIQAAINAGANGDTVSVAPGTYSENINFMGKALTVISEQGAAVTVIDGGAHDSVAAFVSGEGRGSVLSGFTLQNGLSSFNTPGFGDGGGIWIRNSSPTIQNNAITNNRACEGVGIFVNSGSPLIQGNTISNNLQSGCSGGVGGGGISLLGGPAAQILNNVIERNVLTSADGGGISMFSAGSPTISGNIIRLNTVSGISPCAEGGGISMVNQSDALIVNNVITGNSAGCGGGIYWGVPSGDRGPYVVNNTLAGNTAPQGSAIFAIGFQSQALFINNIVVSSAASTALYCDGTYSSVPPVVTFNDVFAPSGTAFGGVCAGAQGSNGNISADPLFASQAAGDYHLLQGSPAIDAGTANQAPLTDFDGTARPLDGNGDGTAAFDMGAYEFIPVDRIPPVTVANASPGPGPGNWNNTNVTVSLNATDNSTGSGVKQIQYSLAGAQTGGPFVVSGSSASITITAAGATTLSYFATDNAGNVETAKSLTINIDRSAPFTSASPSPLPSGGDWNKTNVAVTLSAIDNPGGSGVKQIQYSLAGAQSGGPFIVPGSSGTFTISSEGTTTVSYYASDIAGNAESAKILSVSLDKTAPVISGMPAPNCTLSPAKHQMVQVAVVTATDALSGVASLNVTATSNEPDSGTGGGDLPGDIVINGGVVQLRAERSPGGKGRIYTITAVATDVAGNSSTATATCTVPK